MIGPVLRHVSAPQPSDQEPGGGDPLPDADGPDQLSVKLAAIDKMTAEEIADAWPEVAAVLKEARLAGRS